MADNFICRSDHRQPAERLDQPQGGDVLAVVAPEGLKLSIVEIEQLRAAQANSPFAR